MAQPLTRTRGDDSISFADWVATIRAYASEDGCDYDELVELYSFQTAYEEGMGAREAFVDCMEWLSA